MRKVIIAIFLAVFIGVITLEIVAFVKVLNVRQQMEQIELIK